jgi:hypothetical protein
MRPTLGGFDEPPADDGATEMRPTPGGFDEPPADEGATEMRPTPGPGFEAGGPPPPPGPSTEPHYAEGPQASSPPPPPPPGGFGGPPPPPPPGGGFGGPEGAPQGGPGGPPPGYAQPGGPPPPPGFAQPGGPMMAPGGFAPQGPMPPKNPVAEWLLAYFVPFYELYWFHRSNKEMEAWSNGRIEYNATSSLLALTLGWFILVPPFIAWSSYVNRVRETQRMAGLPVDVTFWGTVGRAFLILYSVKYLQDRFNVIGSRPPQY